MLDRYHCVSQDDYQNALKEIIQEVALFGLWRAKFFEHAAFYGGTALRILYRLDRFSEDLDFSLLQPNKIFSLTPYLTALESELTSFGFRISIAEKQKTGDSLTKSAFLKANTKELLLEVEAPQEIQVHIHSQNTLSVKLEIDIDPLPGFNTEIVTLLNPVPFWVKSYCLPDLFAGKIAAALFRQWKTRVKGRDWYDFMWFVQNDIPVNLDYLQQRLIEAGVMDNSAKGALSLAQVKKLLHEKIESLDIELAKADIFPFIKNTARLAGWSKATFNAAADAIRCG
jgi:predicted nucleotidyltransferase component of viral defense system